MNIFRSLTNRISLKWKLIGLPLGAVTVLGAAFTIATFYVLSARFENQSKEDLKERIKAVDFLLDGMLERYRMAAEFSARAQPIVAIATGKGSREQADILVKEIMSKAEADYGLVVDLTGNVVAGTSPTENSSRTSLRPAVKSALTGKAAAGFEHDSSDRFAMAGAAPIFDGDRVVGCLVIGNLITGSECVDIVKSLYGVECTLFDGETRTATTLMKDGKRLIGTKIDNPIVIDTVLKRRGLFLNRNTIMGLDYDTAYYPIHDADQHVAGMVFIGHNRHEVRRTYLELFSRLAVILFIAVVAVAFGAFFIARGVGKLLHNLAESMLVGSKEVTQASTLISKSSQELAGSSNEQASSLVEASSALSELTSMVQKNTLNASNALSIGQKTRQAAEHGSVEMGEMTNAMQAIQSSSSDVAEIIKTIDEIAFQTNLLALNAAVEAARAGEAGAGFAVVADEVRSLARRSAAAAKETEEKISTAITRTSQGVDISKRVAGSLNQIVDSVRQLDALVEEVTTASKEQSRGIDQLNNSVGLMESTVQKNAASAEETAAAAEELNAQAHVLMLSVTDLFAFVDGSREPNREGDTYLHGAERKPAAPEGV